MNIHAQPEITLRLPLQPIEETARRMVPLARDIEERKRVVRIVQPARPHRCKPRRIPILDPHDTALADGTDKVEPMGKAAQWDDRTVQEGYGFAKPIEPLLQPVHVARQEVLRVGEAGIGWHREHRTPARFANLEAKAPRTRTAAQDQGYVQTADLDFSRSGASKIEALQHTAFPAHGPVEAPNRCSEA